MIFNDGISYYLDLIPDHNKENNTFLKEKVSNPVLIQSGSKDQCLFKYFSSFILFMFIFYSSNLTVL